MDLALYQILTPLLSLVMIARAVSHFRRGERTIRELVGLFLFWGGIGLVAIFPSFFVHHFESLTGFKSGVTGILFLAVLILGMLVFHLLSENEKRRSEITHLVRGNTLREAKKNK